MNSASGIFHAELGKLPATYAEVLSFDVSAIKAAIAAAGTEGIIAVGSGGSFTVASVLCSLHEAYTGRLSRPSTPLEISCNPTLASTSPVFFVSAEGKNPDILEAIKRARDHSARAIHLITNQKKSPLIDLAQASSGLHTHVFELKEKDGYLATNSLLATATLVARAYGELDGRTQLPSSLGELLVSGQPIDQWLLQAREFVQASAQSKNIIVAYSPLLKPIAIDLESKLSEAALLHCQLTDVRSFAHGRHLWASEKPDQCSILAIVEPTVATLWEKMRELLPSKLQTLELSLPGAATSDLVVGLAAEMYLVDQIAAALGVDPGKPTVPAFGRDLYYLSLANLIPPPPEQPNRGAASKYDVLGARWPAIRTHSRMQRAMETFRESMSGQRFRAVVFDYDGVLCESQAPVGSLSKGIVDGIRKLLGQKIIVGIASGRGNSIQEELQQCFSPEERSKIQLGLYNGGRITTADMSESASENQSEFLNHIGRIVGRLRQYGLPIDNIRATHPYQISIRFRDGVNASEMWFVIADALRQAGLDPLNVQHSKHSVDILEVGVSKSRLVAHIVQNFKLDAYQVLTIGDQGAWPGNDAALLEHRYSLSVDVPSRRLDRGWNLAPLSKRDVGATLWYLDRITARSDGTFSIEFNK
ncbi:hypothetical protein LJ725_26615 [Reyranella aquatilis]|uniref:SIS domain-containing protein n=1 Tax=Reyranella aquatilis TaxID=2035356 RepID=A0ABS8L2L0_9HYPH|nr:HAD family hydrolase [Reyranella aquatilis]MCC8432559.1 hypothetical protein [Reyranella aquatilis]